MKKQGYLTAQNKGVSAFFTSSSAYDRPYWTSLTEATVYPTAEIAQNALSKLLANGAYSARLVEAASMQFEFPDEGPNKDQKPITRTTDDLPFDTSNLGQNPLDLNQSEDDLNQEPAEDEMTAGQDLEDEINLDDDEIELEDGSELGEEPIDSNFPPQDQENNEQSFMSPMERKMMQGRRPVMPNGNGPVRESFSIPKAGQTNSPADDNTTIATDLKSPEKVKFKQDLRNDRDTNYAADIEPLYKDVKVPANVMSAIKDSIDTFNKAADFNNGRDDSQASLALTVVDALEMIRDSLEQGTHEGLKQAQIKITTLMNPITTNFPPELMDYLYKSGRQPLSLKNAFYDKWDTRTREI